MRRFRRSREVDRDLEGEFYTDVPGFSSGCAQSIDHLRKLHKRRPGLGIKNRFGVAAPLCGSRRIGNTRQGPLSIVRGTDVASSARRGREAAPIPAGWPPALYEPSNIVRRLVIRVGNPLPARENSLTPATDLRSCFLSDFLDLHDSLSPGSPFDVVRPKPCFVLLFSPPIPELLNRPRMPRRRLRQHHYAARGFRRPISDDYPAIRRRARNRDGGNWSSTAPDAQGSDYASRHSGASRSELRCCQEFIDDDDQFRRSGSFARRYSRKLNSGRQLPAVGGRDPESICLLPSRSCMRSTTRSPHYVPRCLAGLPVESPRTPLGSSPPVRAAIRSPNRLTWRDLRFDHRRGRHRTVTNYLDFETACAISSPGENRVPDHSVAHGNRVQLPVHVQALPQSMFLTSF